VGENCALVAIFGRRTNRAKLTIASSGLRLSDMDVTQSYPGMRYPLSQTRSWYRIERRQTYIKAHELAAWYESITALTNDTLRDYLLLILFTGLRRQEAAKLEYTQVDLKAKTITIIDTKNREQHTLPLSNFLYDLLLGRSKTASSRFVFPGPGAAGHIIEPRKQISKVIEKTGIQFTVHDLRRTFITIAESLDIPAYALKRLLNHKMTQDVTAGYIVMDVERLRKPMQKITDYIMRHTMQVSPDITIFPDTKHLKVIDNGR
jgi:integrase